jgi:small subunit ribosomal protein S20
MTSRPANISMRMDQAFPTGFAINRMPGRPASIARYPPSDFLIVTVVFRLTRPLATPSKHPSFQTGAIRPARSTCAGSAHARDLMANTDSARKRIRQNIVRSARNQARRSRMRTFVKKVEAAIAGGDREAANAALRDAQPEMQRAAGKGVIHKNTISRKLSRMTARIKSIPAG